MHELKYNSLNLLMEGKNTVFDIFIRNYESGKPIITMTVSGGMTIGKLKRAFTENCKI
jgi:hypothetical protein